MSAISLRQVSKVFSVSHEKPALVRQLVPRFLRPSRPEPHWALRDITLEIAGGSTVGIIGPNGAGKTTLLSVIAGITSPTRGSVSVRGTVAPLLTLGGGFHPEMTGLENIFLNGSLLGMRTREIRRKLEAIVAFSQLDGFIDAPLQTYSSGMQLRLGFAVAIHADADVLIVDEVLTVGDQAFQAKCLERLLALKRDGKTLILASQGHEGLRPLADRALLLHRGRIIAQGTVAHVQDRYEALLPWLASPQDALRPQAQAAIEAQVARQDPNEIARRWGRREGTGGVRIEEVRLMDARGEPIRELDSGGALSVAVRFRAAAPLPDPQIGVAIFRDDYVYCCGPNTRADGWQFTMLPAGLHECRLHFEALHLTPGQYHLSVSVWEGPGGFPCIHHMAEYPITVMGAQSAGVMVLPHTWRRVPQAPRESPDLPQLSVEGPTGPQMWYRTFEPLRMRAVLGLPPGADRPGLVAECRGPRRELWWSSRWTPASEARIGSERLLGVELEIPQLTLLTGRYRWSLQWEGDRASPPLTQTVDVVADRLDHGVIYLPHQWELRTCQSELVTTTQAIA